MFILDLVFVDAVFHFSIDLFLLLLSQLLHFELFLQLLSHLVFKELISCPCQFCLNLSSLVIVEVETASSGLEIFAFSVVDSKLVLALTLH